MLCKLLTCPGVATARRVHPFGDSNLCGIHAEGYDEAMRAQDSPEGITPSVITALLFACRYGPGSDPPLEQAERGPEYAHGYKTGTE